MLSPIICFSSTPWREAHRLRRLMSGFARRREVFFLEEPIAAEMESLQVRPCAPTGVQVVTPMLPSADTPSRRRVVDLLLARSGSAIAWYAAPEARAFSDHLPWLGTVYDCAEAPAPAGHESESRLMEQVDLVFASGSGLCEDRCDYPPNIHCVPAGMDLAHLEAARGVLAEPADQIGLRRPLLGRFGPVDDRLDLDLLARIASLRPDWHFAMIGEVVTARALPQSGNIHWMGARDEAELPAYLCHWDLAIAPLVPGALPDAAEVPRYLAGGRRVVATPLREISRRFAGLEAVATASTPAEFVSAAEAAMLRTDVSDFVAVDDLLATLSWDAVQQRMAALLTMSQRNAAFPQLPAPLPAF